MPKLYRYTLAFDGQPQNIGLFQGLYDVGLDDTVIDRINAEFSTLKAPDLDEPAEFYFTEAGRKKYDFPPLLCRADAQSEKLAAHRTGHRLHSQRRRRPVSG